MLKLTYEKSFWKNVEKLVHLVCEKYTVVEKANSNQVVDASHILKQLKLSVAGSEQRTQCVGLTKDGEQCAKYAKDDTLYCKIHQLKQRQRETEDTEKASRLYVFKGESESDNGVTLDELETRYIENGIYKVDDQFVYDIETKEKVGFVDNGQYILTDDPFILDSLDMRL